MPTFNVKFICPSCRKRATLFEAYTLLHHAPVRSITTRTSDLNVAVESHQYDVKYGRQETDEGSIEILDYFCSKCGECLDIERQAEMVEFLLKHGYLVPSRKSKPKRKLKSTTE